MKIYLPAWHYRARAIVQRTWGWSPIEEMILLALDRSPGTIEDVAISLDIPIQVAGATVARLMQAGDQERVEVHEAATIRVGNAGAFAFTINGHPAKSLGPPGSIRTAVVSKDTLARYVQ